MQETIYQIQIPAFDYTEDLFKSCATKATNLFGFWFKNNFKLMHFQVNFNISNKLKILSVTNKNDSLDQILSSIKLHQYSPGNLLTHHSLHTDKHHIFVNKIISTSYSPSAQCCLDSCYLQGHNRNYDPLKKTFLGILHAILTTLYFLIRSLFH